MCAALISKPTILQLFSDDHPTIISKGKFVFHIMNHLLLFTYIYIYLLGNCSLLSAYTHLYFFYVFSLPAKLTRQAWRWGTGQFSLSLVKLQILVCTIYIYDNLFDHLYFISSNNISLIIGFLLFAMLEFTLVLDWFHLYETCLWYLFEPIWLMN